MERDFEEAVQLLDQAKELDPTGMQFKRIAAPYFLEAVSRNPNNINACMNAAVVMQCRLYLGAGLPRSQVRYTRRRAWVYHLKGLGGLAPVRRASMDSDEFSSDEDDWSDDSEFDEGMVPCCQVVGCPVVMAHSGEGRGERRLASTDCLRCVVGVSRRF